MSKPETCVCCGRVIPEGSQVCIICGMEIPKKQRQIDRIRGMSVEVFAEMLYDISQCEMNDCNFCPLKNASCGSQEAIKQWLEQEVEE